MRRPCCGSSSRSYCRSSFRRRLYLLWVGTFGETREGGALPWTAMPWIWLAGAGVVLLALVLICRDRPNSARRRKGSMFRRAGKAIRSFPAISSRTLAAERELRDYGPDRASALDVRAADPGGARGAAGRRCGSPLRRRFGSRRVARAARSAISTSRPRRSPNASSNCSRRPASKWCRPASLMGR